MSTDAPSFLADLERKPEALAGLAAKLREDDPWAAALTERPERIVFLGMGSSAYAAEVAAARLRAKGLVATSEIASTDLMPAWGEGTLVIPISANGGSVETLAALPNITPGATVVALTNAPSSKLTAAVPAFVEMHADPEPSGVACRSFQHTLALLLALESHLLGGLDVAALVERSAEATTDLLDRRPEWLPELTRHLDGPDGIHVAAPARRLSSAHQSALMFRECPRVQSIGSDAGDWAHVYVYLTKNTDYRLLTYAGSGWDAGIREWTEPRGTTVVSVGGDFDGAAYTLRYAHDEDDDVRLLTETLVAELTAAQLWVNQG